MKKTLPIILIIFLIVAFGAVWKFSKKELQQPVITEFEECAKAGYPILETYPEQCRTPDGRSFTKSINSSGAEFDSLVTLRLNEQSKFNDGLTVTLVEINDSRCKSGVVCVWAGELAFQFKLLGGNINQDTEIKLGTVIAKSITQGGYTFTLKEATENTSIITVTKVNPSPQTEIILKAGEREGSLLVQKIYPTYITGLNFREYPVATDQGQPITLQIGETASNGCTVSLTLVKIIGGTAIFTEKIDNNKPCPICLAKNTLIDTPQGAINVQDLQTGAPVWTVNKSGERVVGEVEKISKTAVPSDHKMVQLVLYDGRTLLVSPGHPTIDGRTVGDLAPGDKYDGSQVKTSERVSYGEAYTYDILVSDDTGFYFANGILIASTLH